MNKKFNSLRLIIILLTIFTITLFLYSISGRYAIASNGVLAKNNYSQDINYSPDRSSQENPPTPENDMIHEIDLEEIKLLKNPKMDSDLSQLNNMWSRSLTREIIEFVETHGVRMAANRIQVNIYIDEEELENVIKSIEDANGRVTKVRNNKTILQAWIPLAALETISKLENVNYVRQPSFGIPLDALQIGQSTTEGLTAINGDAWHAQNYKGAGLKITIIDLGFSGYENLLGTDLPSNTIYHDFVDPDNEPDPESSHGTACAEIIYDIAPESTIYLLRIANVDDVYQAVTFAINENIDIISVSLGWFNDGPGDGTGELADIVERARENGILWINSAGNHRQQHWGGTYREGEEENTHYWEPNEKINYFTPGLGLKSNIPGGSTIEGYLRWDDWTNKDQDYDLYLLRWDSDINQWMVVARGATAQDGGENQKPIETIVYIVPEDQETAPYGFWIKRFNSNRDVNFEFFSNLEIKNDPWWVIWKKNMLAFQTYDRSILFPSDSPNAIAVAALNIEEELYPQEEYSSQGPTNGPGGTTSGGYIKPDISGFAQVATESYDDPFAGTSAAAPHVAGAAALVLSAFPDFSPDQLQNFLEDRAIQMGAAEKDVIFGYGRLYLADPPAFDFNILSPSQSNPAYAGSFVDPRKIIVEVTKPADGLTKDLFSISIGGIQSDIVILYESAEKYILEVIPPVVTQNDLYDLQVDIDVWGNELSDSETNAIYYANEANIDVELVIDRSGSMGGTPIDSAKQAASQFVDFMNYGDMVGVVSFSSDVTTDFPLTTITPPSTTPPVFTDDMESGIGNWTAESPWGLITTDYHSATHAWTDSPGTSYANYLNVSLKTSGSIHIPTTLSDPALIFSHKYDLEEGYDWGIVEASNNGGSTWTQLGGKYSGTNMTWHKGERSLSSYLGQDILVRFRLTSDSSIVQDGWYIDDVIIGESGSNVKLDAKDAISYISATGMTSIGGGLERGQYELTNWGDVNHPWAIILLTDGNENTSPYVANVLPDIVASKTEVHTIGLGYANQAQLLDIATQTGGTYNYAPTPAELAGIYNTISGVVSNQQTLHASTGTVESGATDIKQVVVDSSVSDATFSIIWSDSSSNINLILKKPDGTFITPFFTFSDEYSEFVAGSNYQFYRIKQPTLTSGVWEMHVTDATLTTALEKNETIRGDRTETYIARVTANTSLTAQLYLDRDNYFTHQPIKLITLLSDTQPITNATVTATINPPTGFVQTITESEWIEINGDTIPDPTYLSEAEERSIEDRETLQLFDDGQHGDGAANDGIYANYYNDAVTPGSYKFSISAEGFSTDGDHFIRLTDRSTYIKCGIFLPVWKSSESSGFDSQFNGNSYGWEPHSGTWNTDSNYLWTDGLIGSWSTVSYSDFFDNFDYQVRMWRFGSSSSNNIIIRGTPSPLNNIFQWNSSYIFQYSRAGAFSVYKILSDGSITALQSWASSSAINTGDAWNTLRVVANGSNLYFYINGTLVWSGSDTSLSSGRVGIGMYSSIEDDYLYVDWAKLTTNISRTATGEIIDEVSFEQQLINDEANKNQSIEINGID